MKTKAKKKNTKQKKKLKRIKRKITAASGGARVDHATGPTSPPSLFRLRPRRCCRVRACGALNSLALLPAWPLPRRVHGASSLLDELASHREALLRRVELAHRCLPDRPPAAVSGRARLRFAVRGAEEGAVAVGEDKGDL